MATPILVGGKVGGEDRKLAVRNRNSYRRLTA
jgi:hypothetical protein